MSVSFPDAEITPTQNPVPRAKPLNPSIHNLSRTQENKTQLNCSIKISKVSLTYLTNACPNCKITCFKRYGKKGA